MAVEEVLVVEDAEEERLVRVHAADAELLERAAQLDGSVLALGGAAGDLHQEAVVVRRDVGADEPGPVVDADAEPAGGAEHVDRARVGAEVVGRVLRGDAALHGVPDREDGVLREAEVGQALPRRDADLRLDQVDARHLLRHRVLHLREGRGE